MQNSAMGSEAPSDGTFNELGYVRQVRNRSIRTGNGWIHVPFLQQWQKRRIRASLSWTGKTPLCNDKLQMRQMTGAMQLDRRLSSQVGIGSISRMTSLAFCSDAA